MLRAYTSRRLPTNPPPSPSKIPTAAGDVFIPPYITIFFSYVKSNLKFFVTFLFSYGFLKRLLLVHVNLFHFSKSKLTDLWSLRYDFNLSSTPRQLYDLAHVSNVALWYFRNPLQLSGQSMKAHWLNSKNSYNLLGKLTLFSFPWASRLDLRNWLKNVGPTC